MSVVVVGDGDVFVSGGGGGGTAHFGRNVRMNYLIVGQNPNIDLQRNCCAIFAPLAT